jgi:hypothetical protein
MGRPILFSFGRRILPGREALSRRQQPFFLPIVRIMQPAGLRSTLIQ